MKRKYIVVIVLQAIVIFLTVIDSFHQKTIAGEQLKRAVEMSRKADLNRKKVS